MVDDGGPAFPTHIYDPNVEADPRFSIATIPGMSLRDWFASSALQGIMLSALGWDDKTRSAAIAYEIADVMLKVRAR